MFMQSRKCLDYASLISILLLALLHQFVIFAGQEYYGTLKYNIGIIYINYLNYSLREFTFIAVAWEIAIAISTCISLALIVCLYAKRLTKKRRYILALILLGLQVAINVSLAYIAFSVSNRQQYLYEKLKINQNDKLDNYANWLIIDARLTLVLGVLPIAILSSGINLSNNQQQIFQI